MSVVLSNLCLEKYVLAIHGKMISIGAALVISEEIETMRVLGNAVGICVLETNLEAVSCENNAINLVKKMQSGLCIIDLDMGQANNFVTLFQIGMSSESSLTTLVYLRSISLSTKAIRCRSNNKLIKR